jgi:radical SAM protein with 4Fe4S-binding SPASM domain
VLDLIDRMQVQKLSRPIVEMQFSIFDENEHEVDDFIAFWLARGVVVKTRPKVYWSGLVAGGSARVTLGKDRAPCLWAMDTACVHANGNVVMCALDSEGQYVAGSVETQSVKDVWNGPLKWVRELHMRRRFRDLPEICRKCPDWQVKRAQTHFPSEVSRLDYESYIRLGRVFHAETLDAGGLTR